MIFHLSLEVFVAAQCVQVSVPTNTKRPHTGRGLEANHEPEQLDQSSVRKICSCGRIEVIVACFNHEDPLWFLQFPVLRLNILIKSGSVNYSRSCGNTPNLKHPTNQTNSMTANKNRQLVANKENIIGSESHESCALNKYSFFSQFEWMYMECLLHLNACYDHHLRCLCPLRSL